MSDFAGFKVIEAPTQQQRAELKPMVLAEGQRYLRLFDNNAFQPAPLFPGQGIDGDIGGYNDTQNLFVARLIEKNEAEFVIVTDGQLVPVKKTLGKKLKEYTVTRPITEIGSQDLVEA